MHYMYAQDNRGSAGLKGNHDARQTQQAHLLIHARSSWPRICDVPGSNFPNQLESLFSPRIVGNIQICLERRFPKRVEFLYSQQG